MTQSAVNHVNQRKQLIDLLCVQVPDIPCESQEFHMELEL